jgi:AAA ATPase domain
VVVALAAVDPLRNPFSMSAGNPPAALTGREEQIEQFKRLLGRLANGRNEQSMIVSGLRGVGKTVLLLEFESIAEREGWTSAEPIEIRSDTNFRAEMGSAVYEALMRLDRRRALGERLKRFLGLLDRFKAGISSDGSVELSIDTARKDQDDALERDLRLLLVELGEAAQGHETGVVLLVDEMQFLARGELEAIAASMHRLSQRQLPVALAGTGLPQLPGLLVDAKSYAERLFSYPRLGALGADAARAALVWPAEEEGVTFDGDALERIVAVSGGYPTFIQAYGREAWNVAPAGRITLADVEACEAIVQSKLDEEFFHVRFEKATPRERRYMAAMAVIGDGPYRRSEVADRLGSTLPATSSVRDTLIKKGLVFSPDHGVVDFTVPHFAPFMRRRYPLTEGSD